MGQIAEHEPTDFLLLRRELHRTALDKEAPRLEQVDSGKDHGPDERRPQRRGLQQEIRDEITDAPTANRRSHRMSHAIGHEQQDVCGVDEVSGLKAVIVPSSCHTRPTARDWRGPQRGAKNCRMPVTSKKTSLGIYGGGKSRFIVSGPAPPKNSTSLTAWLYPPSSNQSAPLPRRASLQAGAPSPVVSGPASANGSRPT